MCIIAEFEALSHWFEFLTTSPDLDLKVDLIIYLRTKPEKVRVASVPAVDSLKAPPS